MKSATLASLLITSAAAGAAAAGGPFFFAQTCPMAIALEISQGGGGVVYPHGVSTTVAQDFVITDFTVNRPSDYAIIVNGVPACHWQYQAGLQTGTASSLSFSDGAGIPVPAGSTLKIESTSDYLRCSFIGYHF